MSESGHVYTVPPRRNNPATQPIVEISPPGSVGPLRLEIDGWTIQVVGDAVFISCEGEVMTQTRTGKLNRKEIVVRRDPPSHARGTEVLG